MVGTVGDTLLLILLIGTSILIHSAATRREQLIHALQEDEMRLAGTQRTGAGIKRSRYQCPGKHHERGSYLLTGIGWCCI